MVSYLYSESGISSHTDQVSAQLPLHYCLEGKFIILWIDIYITNLSTSQVMDTGLC